MKRYKNAESGISAYKSAEDHILIQFRHGATYRYTYKTTGKDHVETMKRLAATGRGLNTYISQVVRDRYEEKIA